MCIDVHLNCIQQNFDNSANRSLFYVPLPNAKRHVTITLVLQILSTCEDSLLSVAQCLASTASRAKVGVFSPRAHACLGTYLSSHGSNQEYGYDTLPILRA